MTDIFEMIYYLEQQTERINSVNPARTNSIQLFLEYCDSEWQCCYGWHEAFDGKYSLSFLEAHNSDFELAIRELFLLTKRVAEHIDDFLSIHRKYDYSGNDALCVSLTESGVETQPVTNIEIDENSNRTRWTKELHGKPCKHSGLRWDIEKFWIKKE